MVHPTVPFFFLCMAYHHALGVENYGQLAQAIASGKLINVEADIMFPRPIAIDRIFDVTIRSTGAHVFAMSGGGDGTLDKEGVQIFIVSGGSTVILQQLSIRNAWTGTLTGGAITLSDSGTFLIASRCDFTSNYAKVVFLPLQFST